MKYRITIEPTGEVGSALPQATMEPIECNGFFVVTSQGSFTGVRSYNMPESCMFDVFMQKEELADLRKAITMATLLEGEKAQYGASVRKA